MCRDDFTIKSSRMPWGLGLRRRAFRSVFSTEEEVSLGSPDHSVSVFLSRSLTLRSLPPFPAWAAFLSLASAPFNSHLLGDSKCGAAVEGGGQRTGSVPDSLSAHSGLLHFSSPSRPVGKALLP